jgi:hypothetical protein
MTRTVLGCPKDALAHALMWEHSNQRLKLAELLGQLGIFLTLDEALLFSISPSGSLCAHRKHICACA